MIALSQASKTTRQLCGQGNRGLQHFTSVRSILFPNEGIRKHICSFLKKKSLPVEGHFSRIPCAYTQPAKESKSLSQCDAIPDDDSMTNDATSDCDVASACHISLHKCERARARAHTHTHTHNTLPPRAAAERQQSDSEGASRA